MMYMIVLELNGRPPGEYPALERAIKATGNWSNRMRNVWWVESELPAAKIRDELKPHVVAGKDKVFVARIGKGWSGSNMGDGFQEWMNRRNFDAPKK
jgi:hypothetical protein